MNPAAPGGTGTWDYSAAVWESGGSLFRWTDVTGLDTAAFSGTGDFVHLGAPTATNGLVTANGLTFNTTGYTIDNGGSALSTLSLVTSAVAGPAPVITSNAANLTSTISASILGNDGLQFTAGAFVGTTTKVTGDNKFINGVTISSGTVELGNAGALNRSNPNALTFGTSATIASALRLNGNSVAIRDLTGATNVSGITNGAAGNAILTVYQQNDKLVKTVLGNGTAGTLELIKDGPATLTMGSDNPYGGATTVRGSTLGGTYGATESGTLELAGNNVGRLTATSSLNISDGGTLRLTNSLFASGAGGNNGDRIPTVSVNMRGGSFVFANNASNASFAETTGALNILTGTNNIFAQAAATGQTSVLTFASLNRSPGSVVTFQSQYQLSDLTSQVGVSTQDQIIFTAAPALNDTMIGGWALFDDREFATYNTTAPASVKIVTTTLNQATDLWATTSNQKVDQSGAINLNDISSNGLRTVNSLNMAADNISLELNGLTLNVDTGGLISQSSGLFGGAIDNGSLTAGTAAGSELFLIVPNLSGTLTIASNTSIINNGVGQVNSVGLVKAGPGAVWLQGPNFYTGPTSIVGGTLQIDFDSSLGTNSGSNPLKIYDGTLYVSSSLTLNVNRPIEVGGNSFISVKSGTTGTGKVFTFSGSISSIAGTGGSLSFLSNATDQPEGADPGKINVQLNAALLLGGSLRIDATSSTGVFRPNAGFANSIGRSLQIGMNGSAVFTQTGGSLSVGAGIDDTLDIGVRDAVTFSTVAKIGTLTLTGVSQFTAKVDTVRIGVQTQTNEAGLLNNTSGTVTLASNNDISAGTSIVISDNANASGSTLTASNVTLGAGINNLTTQSFTIGGRKGTSTVTLPASGTLNLRGFADRTLNLSIGRTDNSDTAVISTGTLTAAAANTIFTGSFDTIVLGEKTGSTLAGGATGTLTLGASTQNYVTANTVQIGVDKDFNGTPTATTNGTGTLNMGGGIFTVYNDVVLATQATRGSARGNLNITGGTFNVGGNITKTNSDLSNGVITVNGATAQLNLRNPLVNDTTSGSVTASQFVFRLGTVTNVAALTLDGRDVTSSLVLVPLTDALIVRDVTLATQINLTGTVADKGGIHYEAAGGGAGGTLASVSLGSVARTFNVENSNAAPADLTVSGAITGAGLLTKSGTGTLLLNGPVAGSVSDIAGALGGTGTITGAVNVGSSGTLTPGGSSIGTLATGALTFAANATLALDINFVARTSDKTVVNGAFALDASLTTVLSITDLNPIGTFSFFNLPIVDYTTWNGNLFTVGGVVIDDYDATTNPNSAKFFVGPNRYAIDYNANGGHSVWLVSIPEPGSLALLAGGVALLGGLRRRRR